MRVSEEPIPSEERNAVTDLISNFGGRFDPTKRLITNRVGIQLVMIFFLLLTPSFVNAQTDGNALLERCITATRQARTLQARLSVSGVGAFQKIVVTGTLRLQKPNLGHIDITTSEMPTPIRRNCDGKLLSYFVDSTHYVLEEASPDGNNLMRDSHCNEAAFFFDSDLLRILRTTGTGMEKEGTTPIGGTPCQVLRLTGGPEGLVYRLYVGPDGLVRGTDAITRRPGQFYGLQSRLTDVQVNRSFGLNPFRFIPKNKELPYLAGKPGPAMRALTRIDKMPAVGMVVNDFTLNDLEDKPVSLFDVLRGNRVTLLNFWGVHCPPCRIELPQFNAQLAEWKSKQVGVLTVNLQDSLHDIQQIWKNEGLGLQVLLKGGIVAQQYGIVGIPTTFLLDANGKVIESIVGLDTEALNKALQKAGIK